MARVKVSELNIGDYLSEAVYKDSFNLLLFEGTKLSENDIEMLKSNGINQVSIFKESSRKIKQKEKEIITHEIHDDCKVRVKSLINTHICGNNANLKELSETAENIVEDIFKSDEIASKIYDIKQKSSDIYDHSVTVSSLSILTALKFNLHNEEVCDIGVGSLLHDIGLKYLSVNYINREYNDFTPDEIFEYKKHTLYGFSSVENERWMSTSSKRIILHHHETLDGTGYPFRQTSISLPVRIVSVCDGFHDRISGIGRKAMKVDEALRDIEKYRDIYYDGKVVDIFEAFIAMYPVGTKVLTNRGEEGIVVEQTEYSTDRPIIKITKNSKGELVTKDKYINLSENRSITIEKSI